MVCLSLLLDGGFAVIRDGVELTVSGLRGHYGERFVYRSSGWIGKRAGP
jgi:hypothetical protein